MGRGVTSIIGLCTAQSSICAGIPCHNVELLLCQLSLMGKGPMEIPNEDKPGGSSDRCTPTTKTYPGRQTCCRYIPRVVDGVPRQQTGVLVQEVVCKFWDDGFRVSTEYGVLRTYVIYLRKYSSWYVTRVVCPYPFLLRNNLELCNYFGYILGPPHNLIITQLYC